MPIKLSKLPFELTVTVYRIVLLMSAFSDYLLTLSLLKNHSTNSAIHQAVGNKFKERVLLIAYGVGLILSFPYPMAAFALYFGVALVWLYPDSRIENTLR